MSSHFRNNSAEKRSLSFTIGALVFITLLSAILFEKKLIKIKPQSLEKDPVQQLQADVQIEPFTRKTTLKIRPLVTRSFSLPDFNRFKRVDKRKAAFFDYLTPIVQYQNDLILGERANLEELSKQIVNGLDFSTDDKYWLQKLAEKYDVEWEEANPGAVVIKLARRVDIIPVSLALVQAAKESSWGRSRYAVEANNLFGQWCFDTGCGVIPEDRLPEATHEVKSFRTVNEAAQSYIHNLNTHPKYLNLRRIRQKLRVHRKRITGEALADGLLYYSERRQAYVDEVKVMIEQYRYFQKRRTD